jgi:hypothetical protein
MARLALIVAALMLTGCASPPPPVAVAKPDPSAEPWYAATIEQLTGLNRKAEISFAAGRSQEAAGIITASQPLEDRILAVPRPTLAALVAASDRDDLYGRMLAADGRYGYARLEFQKNLARWRNWKPRTAESAARLERARMAIAECDRRLAE